MPHVTDKACALCIQHGSQLASRYVDQSPLDDDSDDDLEVISAYYLLISELDVADLDWEEIAERSFIDARRGLVIAQVAGLEEVVDDFIMYVLDPPDVPAYLRKLAGWSIGRRKGKLEAVLREAGVWDQAAEELLATLGRVVDRRNVLVHGAIYCRPTQWLPVKEWHAGMEFEWVLHDRRTGLTNRLLMSDLRADLADAMDATIRLIRFGKVLAARLQPPVNYLTATYMAPPHPKSAFDGPP